MSTKDIIRATSEGFTLAVRDDGIGFPEGLGFQTVESLGLQLVMLLVEQLEGRIEGPGAGNGIPDLLPEKEPGPKGKIYARNPFRVYESGRREPEG